MTNLAPLAQSLGQEAILRKVYEQADLGPLARMLAERAGPRDPAAALDLSTLLMTQGGALAAEGQAMQRAATRLHRSFEIPHGKGTGPRILALVTPGDFMTNTPIDFLLAGTDAVLILHFIDAETESLSDLPPHDVAFMAVGEGPENAEVLRNLSRLLKDFPGPVLNNAPEMILRLSRDRVSAMLQDVPGLLCPPTTRMTRTALTGVARARRFFDYPAVLRPIGSHAGHGLIKVCDPDELVAYLALHPEDEFYVAPFVDYRNAAGRFAKARVVLIGGKPFASHLAVSDHWMVHYLNAAMETNADRRAAAGAWMGDFDTGVAARHGATLALLSERLGLDYFGIDCAEMPDGRLLVFEVDVAMIVYDMDCATLFPYKKPAMRKLFDAFVALCGARSQG